jgi:hypothetical protein
MKNAGHNGKGSKSKALPAAGSIPTTSAMIGGISNRTTTPSFKKSGRTDSFCGGGTVQGGFKNKGMVGRR